MQKAMKKLEMAQQMQKQVSDINNCIRQIKISFLFVSFLAA